MYIDVFNGDADGVCALHQLRQHEPADSELITDIKRNNRLVERVKPSPGAEVTVLDVSFEQNREAVLNLLEQGCHVRYFDHHYAGELPEHEALDARINRAPDVCTSLLVDRYVEGRFRGWAVVGAFGDNLDDAARQAAEPLGLAPDDVEALRELGILMNYNGYGSTVDDLYFHPARLYRAVRSYADPLAFIREAPEASILREGYAEDMARALEHPPLIEELVGKVYVLPATAWARRVMGSYANRLANEAPDEAAAVVIEQGDGTLMVSVRSPLNRPHGADTLCRAFATGGGRSGAAGINRLPEAELPAFLDAFRRTFG